MTTSTSPPVSAIFDGETKYCVQYVNNSSKKWDGKKILLDGKWLESIYPPSELTIGKKLCLPWQVKGGVQYWNAVLVPANSTPEKKKTTSIVTKGKKFPSY